MAWVRVPDCMQLVMLLYPTVIRIPLLFVIRSTNDDEDNDTQKIFIVAYCTVYTIYKLLQHVSSNICSHVQEANTKVMFS
jgi:hypothetical protein